MHKATIEIAATPEQVFRYMTDPKHVESWQPDVVDARPIPPGGLRVGAQVGRMFDGDLVVAALTPNEHIAYIIDAPAVAARIDYRLVRWGDRTRLVSTAIVRPKGWLRPLYFLAKGMVRRKMESRLRLLRDVVEAGRGGAGFSLRRGLQPPSGTSHAATKVAVAG